MKKPEYEVLYKSYNGGCGGGLGTPDHLASAMKYYADTLLYLDEKYSACGGETGITMGELRTRVDEMRKSAIKGYREKIEGKSPCVECDFAGLCKGKDIAIYAEQPPLHVTCHPFLEWKARKTALEVQQWALGRVLNMIVGENIYGGGGGG